MRAELNFEAEPFAFEFYARGGEPESPFGAGELETPGEAVTPQSVIDSRIDVHAQFALLRLAKGDPGARADAAGMLAAVKAGRLGGIYKEDQQVPALRAKQVGKGWWEVIPQGQDAALFAEPSGPPLVVFRDRVRSDAPRLDPALRAAWQTFLLTSKSECRLPGTTQAEFGAAGVVPANLFPRLACSLPVTTLPAGLVLLPHLIKTKSLPSGGAGSVRLMTPARMNPGFVNAATDALARNTSPGGLQTRLNALVEGKHKKNSGKISIALVDLSDARRFAPDFAGWRETEPVVGASLPKICALYPAHQLRFELQTIADQLKLSTKADVVNAARGMWDAAGLARDQQPNLDEMFDYTPAPSKPVAVTPSDKLKKLITCTYEKNCNWAASLLIDRVGLAYIGSVMWQSGLFHPTRGGLWLKAPYSLSCDCAFECCFPKSKIEKKLKPVNVTPSANTTHNATALSAATYFTLMAQGRMGDDLTSARVQLDLEPACSWFGGDQLACKSFTLSTDPSTPRTINPTKCGIFKGFVHDVTLVQRAVSPDCRGRVIRYAVAMMTTNVVFSGAQARPIFRQLLADVDELIRLNNP